ncbi:MAG: Asp-tRNA(Asn)/Glu-tRNA(Gln) amidotransferase subunit GatB [Patescibacteria group bacterium]|nr:Asp-tRNA(Asn)/Glu-tRNA(Gln) amidotransferase subunit GatB [Patescibacteria group bacterium]
MYYFPTIGLEIHIELKTRSKMFCSCLNDPHLKQANVNICPVCMAHPGTLPNANKQAIEFVIMAGLALNCEIAETSKFDRKNYFYPDLPKGYQISQYDMPFCEHGFLEVKSQEPNFEFKKIRIKRIHMEEDTGKLIHPKGEDYSLVDFNRAGVPLMELVSEADIHSAKDARKFAEELRLIFRYLNISDANMEKGQMRVEVNISVQKVENGEEPKINLKESELGTKVEIKNLNSFRIVEKSIEHEIKRQSQDLEKGKKIIHETRGWNEDKNETFSQRKKEKANDYRYFPEPDLPIMKLGENGFMDIKEIKNKIPELPQEKRSRYKQEYNLSDNEIEIFIQNKNLAMYFENVMSELRNWVKETQIKTKIHNNDFFKLSKLCCNYIITDLQGLLKNKSVKHKDFLITSENFAEFISLIYKKEISSKIAKIVLLEMFDKGADPSHIIEDKGLKQITNEKEIEEIIKQIISENKNIVEGYKKGKQSVLQFLIGQAMAKTKGKANPELVVKIFKNLLNEK